MKSSIQSALNSYLVSAVGSLQCDVFILTVIHLCAVMPGTQEILTVNHLSLGETLPLFFSASLLLQPRGVFGSPAFSGTLGSGFGGGRGYLVLLRCGEPGLDEESSLLVVSMRDALLWSGLPAEDSGLFTAARTFADLG